jgi:hypothetical protein
MFGAFKTKLVSACPPKPQTTPRLRLTRLAQEGDLCG